jgi:hypothetical protein
MTEHDHPFVRSVSEIREMIMIVEEALGQAVQWHGTSYFDETGRIWIRAITLHASGDLDSIFWLHVDRSGECTYLTDREMQMQKLSRRIE